MTFQVKTLLQTSKLYGFQIIPLAQIIKSDELLATLQIASHYHLTNLFGNLCSSQLKLQEKSAGSYIA